MCGDNVQSVWLATQIVFNHNPKTHVSLFFFLIKKLDYGKGFMFKMNE